MLPNTFVAGAQKSGTTSLCAALDLHPDAVISTPKEPGFFSITGNLARLDLYQECFRAKAGTSPRAVVDGSNVYMVDPSAPIRMREILGGNLRFIFSLREPAGRAISGYWHQVKKGRERRPISDVLCFEADALADAVQEEEKGVRKAAEHGTISLEDYADFDDPLWSFRYLRNSLYTDDLRRFRDVFGADRVRVILLETFVRTPAETLSNIAEFLDLDPAAFALNQGAHRNATALVRSTTLLKMLRQLPGRDLLRQVPGSKSLRDRLLFRPPPSEPSVEARLRTLMGPELIRLEALLECKLATTWAPS